MCDPNGKGLSRGNSSLEPNEVQPLHRELRYNVWANMAAVIGIGLAFVAGSSHFGTGSLWGSIGVSVGTGLLSAGIIGCILDYLWDRTRTRIANAYMKQSVKEIEQTVVGVKANIEKMSHNVGEDVKCMTEDVTKNLKTFQKQLQGLQGRLEAFENIGLSYCHPTRALAASHFLPYAKKKLEPLGQQQDEALPIDNSGSERDCDRCVGTINVVSSSARGLIGHLDREARPDQEQWRYLMMKHPNNFRILLTHPAFAHLRQPAEERGTGEIECEIIKTMLFLHCVCGMKAKSLRLYRGSPSVFMLEVDQHVLLNPYSYGKMAMDTLCLEFDITRSEPENIPNSDVGKKYVKEFANKHFHEPWFFDSKRVDGRPLVQPVSELEDILSTFEECVYISNPARLRFTAAQIEELDSCLNVRLPEQYPSFTARNENVFAKRVQSRSLKLREDEGTVG